MPGMGRERIYADRRVRFHYGDDRDHASVGDADEAFVIAQPGARLRVDGMGRCDRESQTRVR